MVWVVLVRRNVANRTSPIGKRTLRPGLQTDSERGVAWLVEVKADCGGFACACFPGRG